MSIKKMDLDVFKEFSPYNNSLKRNRLAAILVPIVDINGQDYIMYEVRSHKLKSQPGEVAFPGGKIDPGEMPLDAAIRETCEEIGCKKSDIEIICQLDYLVAHSRVLMHPFLGRVKYMKNYPFSKSEVDEVFFVPVSFFLDNEPEIYKNRTEIIFDKNLPFDLIPDGENYKFPKPSNTLLFYQYGEYVIWGLTAMITKNFIDYYRHLKDSVNNDK